MWTTLVAVAVAVLSLGVVSRLESSVSSAVASRAQVPALPLLTRAAASTAFGSRAPSFATRRQGSGYRLGGGGVTVSLNRDGVVFKTGLASTEMKLDGVGRGSWLAPDRRGTEVASANRVVYNRGSLREWYAAGPLGIEQGFTVAHRLRGSGPFTVTFALGGSTHPRLTKSGLIFLDQSNRAVLRYGDLNAVDATGRWLRTDLHLVGHSLSLRVYDRGAVYPLRIDPFVQQGAPLTGGEESPPGEFGASASLSADGNTALVGSWSDNLGRGAAWVFTRSGGIWNQEGPKLTGGGTGTSWEHFGASVALSADGNTALVGAPVYNGQKGAVWVFTRSGGVWTQQGPVLGGGEESGEGEFGESVALSSDGNTALIGGGGDSGFAGAAWMFTRSGGTWIQQGHKLTAGDKAPDDFGKSVALSGDGTTALIGGHDGNAGAGAAWVFARSGEDWTQQGPALTASGETVSGDFGWSVALSSDGNTALVGGWNANAGKGAAWVFTRSGSAWTEQQNLGGPNEENREDFGASVALSGDGNTALIGGSTGNHNSGAAWVFTRSGPTFNQEGPTLTACAAKESRFGDAVALSADGETALIGGFASNALAGAAWVFARSPSVFTCPTATKAKPPAPKSASKIVPSGYAALVKSTLAVQDSRQTAVKLTCRGISTCGGMLTLSTKPAIGTVMKNLFETSTIGTAAFSIESGKTAMITIALNSAGRERLKAAHGKLNASLTINESSPIPPSMQEASVYLVLQKAKARKGKTKVRKRKKHRK